MTAKDRESPRCRVNIRHLDGGTQKKYFPQDHALVDGRAAATPRDVRKLDRRVSGRISVLEAEESTDALRHAIGPLRLMLAGGMMTWPTLRLGISYRSVGNTDASTDQG
jgi:hypothetical protein